jgi:hypothetical protein
MTAPMVAGSAGLRFPLGHSGIPVRRLLHGQVEGQFVFQISRFAHILVLGYREQV